MLLLLSACGADSSADAAMGAPEGRGKGSNFDDPGPGAGGGVASGDGQSPPPPERELESSYGAPVATGQFVWIANPDSGRVAYIDAASLTVSLVDAGNGPRLCFSPPFF